MLGVSAPGRSRRRRRADFPRETLSSQTSSSCTGAATVVQPAGLATLVPIDGKAFMLLSNAEQLTHVERRKVRKTAGGIARERPAGESCQFGFKRQNSGQSGLCCLAHPLR